MVLLFELPPRARGRRERAKGGQGHWGRGPGVADPQLACGHGTSPRVPCWQWQKQGGVGGLKCRRMCASPVCGGGGHQHMHTGCPGLTAPARPCLPPAGFFILLIVFGAMPASLVVSWRGIGTPPACLVCALWSLQRALCGRGRRQAGMCRALVHVACRPARSAPTVLTSPLPCPPACLPWPLCLPACLPAVLVLPGLPDPVLLEDPGAATGPGPGGRQSRTCARGDAVVPPAFCHVMGMPLRGPASPPAICKWCAEPGEGDSEEVVRGTSIPAQHRRRPRLQPYLRRALLRCSARRSVASTCPCARAAAGFRPATPTR